MPAPISPQNRFKEQFDNNVYLRNKMATAFIQVTDALSTGALGALDDFTVIIDGIAMRHRPYDAVTINDQPYSSCSPILRKQAYDRLDKFMLIALERYNIQYNL
jgi:hypothetical protein